MADNVFWTVCCLISLVKFTLVVQATADSSPCAQQCEKAFQNATAHNCTLCENTTCEFECNPGYRKAASTTNMTLTCTEQTWLPSDTLCEVFQCEESFQYATIASKNCSRKENTTCEFHCNHGYRKTGNTTDMMLTCTENGWNFSENSSDILCEAEPRSINLLEVGLGLGAALTVVLVALGAAFFLRRRAINRKFESFSNVTILITKSSLSFDNPAFGVPENRSSDEKAEGTGTGKGDFPRLNSMTELESIDLDQNDAAVLTTESWQKEKNLSS